jgi:hypothetical protein
MDLSYDAAIEEWELVAFDVVAQLLDKLGLRPTDVSPARLSPLSNLSAHSKGADCFAITTEVPKLSCIQYLRVVPIVLQIDIVITTTSTLTSIPSLSARICNNFNMRKDTQNFSLAGHGEYIMSCTGFLTCPDPEISVRRL